MINVVTKYDWVRFRGEIDEMHRDRKRVFVDLLNWQIPVVDDLYEIDQFDTSDAVYFIALDGQTNRHLGSLRLLPTNRPHLLGELFPHLCARGVPSAPNIWEITRLCTAPGLKAFQRREVRQQLITGLVEFGLLNGIARYTCVAEIPWISQILAMGWNSEPLGMPVEADGQMIAALALDVTPATLQLFRQQWGCECPVLSFDQSVAA